MHRIIRPFLYPAGSRKWQVADIRPKMPKKLYLLGNAFVHWCSFFYFEEQNMILWEVFCGIFVDTYEYIDPDISRSFINLKTVLLKMSSLFF